jgi:formate hydrogenlyase subunit 4
MKTIMINLTLMAIVPFVFSGVITRVKAIWAGRKGAPVLQPFFDLLKLMKKGEVISLTTTGIFAWAPVIAICATLGAGTLVPMACGAAITGFEGDFILFAYLLALAKFLSLAAAMDTGSSFEGMGSSREAVFSALVEPAFFILMAGSAAASGSGGFSGIMAAAQAGSAEGVLASVIAAAALFIMMLVEGCRVPVDDPDTHLELTMIHEAMVLDNSGPSMALINYTAALKMFLISSLFANFLIPRAVPPAAAAALYAAIILSAAVLAGCVESLMARLRMTHVPQFVFYMTTLSGAAFFIVLIFIPGGIK